MIQSNAYKVSTCHGENGTVHTVVKLYGPTLAGWEPVMSFRIGDVFNTPKGDMHPVKILQTYDRNGISWVDVEPQAGIWKGETSRWAVQSLLGMVKVN